MNHVALPHDFYDSNCWRINIIKHYVNNKYSYEILEYPVQALTVSLETIIKVYGNYPEDVMVLLSQTTNPLFTSDEYKDNIYTWNLWKSLPPQNAKQNGHLTTRLY